MDSGADKDYGLVISELDKFFFEIKMLIKLNAFEPIFTLMRRYDHHVDNSLLITLNKLILLEEDLLVLIFFKLIFKSQDILSLLFIRVRIKKSKLNALNLFRKEKVKFQNQLLIFVQVERYNRMRQSLPRGLGVLINDFVDRPVKMIAFGLNNKKITTDHRK
jgi:hypothetical protein